MCQIFEKNDFFFYSMRSSKLLCNSQAAAAGGSTSVSLPPSIQGLEEAAVTDADNRTNSRAVNWGFCPARLSKSCMSSSRLERAAQTCSSRLELEDTVGLRLLPRWLLLSGSMRRCDVPFSRYSLYSALSNTPLFLRRVFPKTVPNTLARRPPSMDSPSFFSTEVSVDSDTLDARNWTCRKAVSPAVWDHEESSLLFFSIDLLLSLSSPFITSGESMVAEESPLTPFIVKTGAGLKDREKTP